MEVSFPNCFIDFFLLYIFFTQPLKYFCHLKYEDCNKPSGSNIPLSVDNLPLLVLFFSFLLNLNINTTSSVFRSTQYCFFWQRSITELTFYNTLSSVAGWYSFQNVFAIWQEICKVKPTRFTHHFHIFLKLYCFVHILLI